MWLSYKGANDWKVCALVPKTDADKKEAHESIRCVLNAHIARMSLIMWEGEVGAVGTTDEAAMGYYLVKWLSEPYTLQTDTAGMSGMIPAKTIVADALYFNRVQHTPHWYTPSGVMTVVKIKYVMRTDLQLQQISTTNALPLACARAEATQKKTVKVLPLDHEGIMEEVSKHGRLEYDENNDDNDKRKEESDEESEENESKLENK
jgi:hypothetical protein